MFEVFACEAGTLLARAGIRTGPHSTWNFTVNSGRMKVICLNSLSGSDNSTVPRHSRAGRFAGRGSMPIPFEPIELGGYSERKAEKIAGNPAAPMQFLVVIGLNSAVPLRGNRAPTAPGRGGDPPSLE